MTLGEKIKLLTYNFDELWNDLWHDGEVYIKNEAETSKIKFNKLKDGIKIKRYTLSSLVDNDPTDWESPEWGFPKVVVRQVKMIWSVQSNGCEETGLLIETILSIIFSLTMRFSWGQIINRYKHNISSICVPHEQCGKLSKIEVSAMKWMRYEEVLQKAAHMM